MHLQADASPFHLEPQIFICSAYTCEVEQKLVAIYRYFLLIQIAFICITHVSASHLHFYSCSLAILLGHEGIVEGECHDTVLVTGYPVGLEGLGSL